TARQGPNDSDETYDFEWSTAHDGFKGTLQDPKKRGPFTNDKDYCWLFDGTIAEWSIWD
ncbi:21588_t:CDS:2, partial [Racocetra persica]